MRFALIILALTLSACITDGPESAGSKPDYAEASRLNSELGADYLRKGQLELAKEKLERAVEQDSDNAQAHASLALVHAQRGDTREAKRHFRKALSLKNDDPSLKNNYGTFLCDQGEVKEAVELFLQAARDRSYPTPEAALTNAGICLRRTTDTSQVEGYFREALQINAEFPDALSQMAQLSHDRGDHLRARAFLQRFERAGKHSAETLRLAAQTERELGDRVAAARYERRLKKEFPDAKP